MADFADDDISADIRTAIAGLNDDAPAEAPQQAAAEAPDLSREPVKGAEEPKQTDAQRARDEHGRFAPKTDDAAAQAAAPAPEAQAPVADPAELQIPRSLSPEAKAAFKEWPELARTEFMRREADTARGVEKLQQELRTVSERYQPLESVIAPHRDKWAMKGMSEGQAIGALVSAQTVLDQNAPYGIAMLAKSYGVDLGQLAAQLQGQGAATPAQADPQTQQLHQKIAALEQRLQAQDQASQTQRLTETRSTIEQFAQDPKHVYFDNVREDMSRLIESGAATGLSDAYQKACWGNETIRNLMLAEQQRTAQTDEEQRRQQHAAQARQAAGQIAGSAGPGSVRALEVDPSASIEDDIRRSMQQLAGRV